jgi:hypothetical protein
MTRLQVARNEDLHVEIAALYSTGRHIRGARRRACASDGRHNANYGAENDRHNRPYNGLPAFHLNYITPLPSDP